MTSSDSILKHYNIINLTCSFNKGHFKATKVVSNFFLIRIFSDTESNSFQENLCLGLLLDCFAGSESFSVFSYFPHFV